MNLLQEIGPGITSLDYVRSQLRMDRPVSVKDLLTKYREPIVLDEPLITPDGVALGGHHTVTLERNGHFRHEGHMLATGFPSFRYGVRTVMGDAAGIPFVAAASGEVHGSNEFGHDRSKWDESGESSGIKLYWAVLKGADHKTDINFESDFFGTIGDVAMFVATLAGGFFVAGSVGVCFVLGVDAADAIGLDEDLNGWPRRSDRCGWRPDRLRTKRHRPRNCGGRCCRGHGRTRAEAPQAHGSTRRSGLR